MDSSAPDFLIRGGTVIDGTNAPGYRADVRLRKGLIDEIAPATPQPSSVIRRRSDRPSQVATFEPMAAPE